MVIIWPGLPCIVIDLVATFIRRIQTCLQPESGPYLEATPLFQVPTCGMQVWKKGNLMRVDGSLMGIDDKAGTLIPQWKRGHFSLLFNGRTLPATLLLVDHRKKTIVDLTKEKKKHQPDIDDEVRPAVEELLSRHTIITLGGYRAPYTSGHDDGKQEVYSCLFFFCPLVQRHEVLQTGAVMPVSSMSLLLQQFRV